MMRKSGIMVTALGTIIVATYSQKSTSRPRKRRRANAYAAKVVNTSCPTVSAAVISTEWAM